MKTICFVTPPAHGHLNPALPLMQELVQRGEQVIAYNHDDFRPQIEQTGALFRAYPPSILTTEAISEALTDGNLSKPHLLMLQAAAELTPFLINELRAQTVDLLVFDSLAIWGKIAAADLKLKGAATISHFVFDLKAMNLSLREYLSMMGQYLSHLPALLKARQRLKQRFGKAYPAAQPLFPMRDKLNLVYTVRELHPASSLIDESFRFVGPSINPQIRSSDFPFEALGSEPIIYISLGTVHHGNLNFYQTCFEAFSDYPAQFVMSVGRNTDIALLGTPPANFIVRNFVPQLEILQRADIFITHGGINSLHEGLYYGVPMIVVPHQFEQLLNARVLVANGAALLIEEVVAGKALRQEMLRGRLEQLLKTPSYSEKAASLQNALRAARGYKGAADELQAYIG